MYSMRFNLTTVFLVTLFVGWVFLASVGDYNLYVVYPDRKEIKDVATISDRVLWSGLFALIFATVDTGAVWIWQAFRNHYSRNSRVSEGQNVA